MPSSPPVLPAAERDQRRRGRAGQRQRQRRLARTHGLCEHCLAQGKTAVATVVNHVVPLAHGGSDRDSNTENLCRPCDLEVTAKQFGHEAPRARGVTTSGRPTNADHPWNQRRSGTGWRG